MPELETPTPERPTLTQRRTIGGNLPKINAFEKPMDKPIERPVRLQSIGRRDGVTDVPPPGKSAGADDSKGGGSAKIVVWVVIVVALAVASYFALRNLLKGPTDNSSGPSPTVVETTVDPLAAIVNPNVLDDSEATSVKADTAYTGLPQSVGAVSDGTFSITNVSVQKFTTFTRFAFEVTVLTGTEPIPATNAEYVAASNSITVSFKNTTTKQDIPFDRDIMVNTDAIDSFSHSSASGTTADSYVIRLNTETGYVIQALGGDVPTIVVDVKETTPPAETIIVTPTAAISATPAPSAAVTATPVASEGDVLDNAYSKTAQVLQNGLTNNSADLGSTFKWSDTATEFNYRKPVILGDGGLYPKVTAQLVDNTLQVEISNLKVKNATSSINFSNSKVVTKLDATRSGNSVKYVFTLTAQKDFRITYDQTAKELLIQVKH